jgi:hypothetical protein
MARAVAGLVAGAIGPGLLRGHGRSVAAHRGDAAPGPGARGRALAPRRERVPLLGADRGRRRRAAPRAGLPACRRPAHVPPVLPRDDALVAPRPAPRRRGARARRGRVVPRRRGLPRRPGRARPPRARAGRGRDRPSLGARRARAARARGRPLREPGARDGGWARRAPPSRDADRARVPEPRRPREVGRPRDARGRALAPPGGRPRPRRRPAHVRRRARGDARRARRPAARARALRALAQREGVREFRRVPALGTEPGFVRALAGIVRRKLEERAPCPAS